MANVAESPHLLLTYERLGMEEMTHRADAFYEQMNKRRSVRFFSEEPVPKHLIERAILTAGTSPSGAHRQPWQFVAISDPELKRQLREAVEVEEKRSYEERMPQAWLEALAPIGPGFAFQNPLAGAGEHGKSIWVILDQGAKLAPGELKNPLQAWAEELNLHFVLLWKLVTCATILYPI